MLRGAGGPISHCPPSDCKLRHILEILCPLLRASLIARLVFCADQAVGSATPVRVRANVAARLFDRLLDMAAIGLGRLQSPGSVLGIGEKTSEHDAEPALAWNGTIPPPVSRRRQRFSKSGA